MAILMDVVFHLLKLMSFYQLEAHGANNIEMAKGRL